jgi:hypothetical protein
MTFPLLTAPDVLSLASLDERVYVVDHLSVHRDIALAMVVKEGSTVGDNDREILVSARCNKGIWRRVDTIGDRDTIDCRCGGGAPWMANRELTFRIPDVVTLKTVVSPRGNWAFVYSDPQGRNVMGQSVVEGNFSP